MKCSSCQCVIDQAEAYRGAVAAGPGHDTVCEDCGNQLANADQEHLTDQ